MSELSKHLWKTSSKNWKWLRIKKSTKSCGYNCGSNVNIKTKTKVKEGETRNVNNWNKHFDKSKETCLEEQDWNEIDNLWKYAEKTPQPMKTPKFTVITKKKNNYRNYHRSRYGNPLKFFIYHMYHSLKKE